MNDRNYATPISEIKVGAAYNVGKHIIQAIFNQLVRDQLATSSNYMSNRKEYHPTFESEVAEPINIF